MAYNFSEDRSEFGKVAERAVKNWFDKELVKYTWLNSEKDACKSYDFVARTVEGLDIKVDVKRTYDESTHTVHMKISNGATLEDGEYKLNAGLFYFSNEAETYFFVNNKSCVDCFQISTKTLKSIIRNKEYTQQVYYDNTVWATIDLNIVPKDRIYYYKFK